MFRVVPPPIIRSANNCTYSIWYLSHCYCYLPLSWKRWNWFECAVGGVGHPQHTVCNAACSIVHSIICTRLFRGKMHSDYFNGIQIFQGRWQHGEKVGYSYPSGIEKTLCKWDIYVLLVMKRVKITVINSDILCTQNCFPVMGTFKSTNLSYAGLCIEGKIVTEILK